MFKDYTKYEVYPNGKIWSYSQKKWLKPFTRKDGYQMVCLYDNEGKPKTYLLHRVIFEAVSGEPIPENLEINHIDERKYNNARSNLELVSPKQNINWGTRNERSSKAQTNNPNRSKIVGAYRNGELVMTFPSTAEAGRQGFNNGHISACCRGVKNYKTHKGYEWRYIKKET